MKCLISLKKSKTHFYKNLVLFSHEPIEHCSIKLQAYIKIFDMFFKEKINGNEVFNQIKTEKKTHSNVLQTAA